MPNTSLNLSMAAPPIFPINRTNAPIGRSSLKISIHQSPLPNGANKSLIICHIVDATDSRMTRTVSQITGTSAWSVLQMISIKAFSAFVSGSAHCMITLHSMFITATSACSMSGAALMIA